MISIDQIKQLREETEVSISECKKALEIGEGDTEKARDILKQWGREFAKKKQTRTTEQGLIETYVHVTGKMGAIVEVRCETDFVARSEDFKNLCHEIALQVASMNPQNAQELLEQMYARDSSRKIKDFIQEHISRLGENIVVHRFCRFEI